MLRVIMLSVYSVMLSMILVSDISNVNQSTMLSAVTPSAVVPNVVALFLNRRKMQFL